MTMQQAIQQYLNTNGICTGAASGAAATAIMGLLPMTQATIQTELTANHGVSAAQAQTAANAIMDPNFNPAPPQQQTPQAPQQPGTNANATATTNGNSWLPTVLVGIILMLVIGFATLVLYSKSDSDTQATQAKVDSATAHNRTHNTGLAAGVITKIGDKLVDMERRGDVKRLAIMKQGQANGRGINDMKIKADTLLTGQAKLQTSVDKANSRIGGVYAQNKGLRKQLHAFAQKFATTAKDARATRLSAHKAYVQARHAKREARGARINAGNARDYGKTGLDATKSLGFEVIE
jgi:hypothetical protein